MPATDLAVHPIHLGRGATAQIEPVFTGDMSWYEAYVGRHAADDAEGRLVSLHTFSEPWQVWERHPHGSEVVLCIAGEITLIQEDAAGGLESVTLAPGQYAINAPGVWHTADVAQQASAVFITAGWGTEHRPR